MSRNMQEFSSNLLYRSKEQYGELVSAVRFLTILPLPDRGQLAADDMVTPPLIRGSGYFPLVGLLLALLLWLLTFIAGFFIPALALAALVVVALIVLTGGLHLDGLMDTCDGLFGGTSREHKLEIMRDSRVGSFGVLGGIGILLLKFAFFASLGAHFLPAALLIALPSARWGMLLAVRVFPSARPGGLGASFRSTAVRNRLLLAGITSLIIALLAGRLVGLFAWLGATIVSLILGEWMTRNLGGLTGDTYGAIVEVAEVIALLVAMIFMSWL